MAVLDGKSGLEDKVNRHVEVVLKEYVKSASKIESNKVFRDVIWGSSYFLPYEVAIIDTPLVQRLRDIKQLDIASLTYPTANHSRFEHTLGVAVAAGKIVDALFTKEEASEKGQIKDKTIQCIKGAPGNKTGVLERVRLAALLHDCGHGPFSHQSERLYENMKDIIEVREAIKDIYNKTPKAHEILSFLIIRSDALQNFFSTFIANNYSISIDLKGSHIAEYIIGAPYHPSDAYSIDIINGALDADKIDYILRDAFYSGLKLPLDLDRLLKTIDVEKDPDGRVRLSIDWAGVTALQQVVFSKMMLQSSVYEQHSVRAAQCLLKGIMKERFKFESAADYLSVSDHDILSKCSDRSVERLRTWLCCRNLPKRAFVLSGKTTDVDGSGCLPFTAYMDRVVDYSSEEEQLRNLILDKVNEGKPSKSKIPKEAVWVSMQEPPKDTEQYFILKKSASDASTQLLGGAFPIQSWVERYKGESWAVYVFAKKPYRADVYLAAKEVFESPPRSISTNRLAWDLCRSNMELPVKSAHSKLKKTELVSKSKVK